MRLIEELIDCGAIARPTALLQNAVSDLQGCPERSARVDDRADPQGIDAATLAAGAD
ncbi:MAG: hypothetical protein WBF49_14395 [Methyloceanibacter sp.]